MRPAAEPYLARRLLLSRRLRQSVVQLGPPRTQPTAPRRCLQQRRIQIGDYHRVFARPRLSDDATVRVEHHGIAGSNLIVVRPDSVAEDQEHSIVVRSARQPPHQPASSLRPAKLGLASSRILMTTRPNALIDRLHRMGAHGITATSLMRG